MLSVFVNQSPADDFLKSVGIFHKIWISGRDFERYPSSTNFIKLNGCAEKKALQDVPREERAAHSSFQQLLTEKHINRESAITLCHLLQTWCLGWWGIELDKSAETVKQLKGKTTHSKYICSCIQSSWIVASVQSLYEIITKPSAWKQVNSKIS